jgi:hypothetical protein
MVSAGKPYALVSLCSYELELACRINRSLGQAQMGLGVFTGEQIGSFVLRMVSWNSSSAAAWIEDNRPRSPDISDT